MKKIKYKIFQVFSLLFLAFYYFPNKKTTFSDLYPLNNSISRFYLEFSEREIKNVKVNKTIWEYYSGGDGKKTILFCHGMGGAYNIWWQQILELEKEYKVISFTLPDVVDTKAETLIGIETILTNENVTTFSVIGSSMGGSIAQYLVQKIPERIEKAVFGNTFPPNDIIKNDNKSIAKIIPYLPEIVIKKFYYSKVLKRKQLPAAQNSELLKAILFSLPFGKKQFINRYKVVTDSFIIEENNPKTKLIPKLCIESDNDSAVKIELREMLKKQYPNATVYTFKKAGHFPYVIRAKEYNKVLLNFLK